MSPEISQKINKILSQKKSYQSFYVRQVDKTPYHEWLKNHLNQMGRITPERLKRMGADPERIDFIMKAEIQSYSDAFDLALSYKDKDLEALFSENYLKRIHYELQKTFFGYEAISYRESRAFMPGAEIVPCNPQRIPAEIARLFYEVSQIDSPILQALELHHQIVVTQPFSDANKRTARLMMNTCLMRAEFAPIIIPPESRAPYVRAIESYYLNKQSENYHSFMLNEMEKSQEEAIRFLKTQPLRQALHHSQVPVCSIRQGKERED